MKKLSVILFAVLFLATAFLYFLHYTGNKSKKPVSNSSQTESPAQGIAYLNIDTVIYKFDMFFDRRGELIEKQQKAEAELNSKGSKYEKGAKDYQEKVSKGLVTRATAAEMEQNLLQQQQELVNLRDNLQANLLEEEQVMNRQIIEYITSYLEEKKADYNFQYILGKSFGSVVLYGDSGLDITQKVVGELNKKYQAEKK
ncbi:MAG: OmpH family outer membrane protein [Bacteroidales bacterium]|jgi:outer membrane protein|nr:OmpH family outer membrane protein [Bacteroidales bacterium]